jgi:hypothetical protein
MVRKSIQIFVILSIVMPTLSCAAAKKPERIPPSVELKLWQAWSIEEAIVRKQANEIIRCSQPEFNSYVCMSGEDLEKVIKELIVSCKQW